MSEASCKSRPAVSSIANSPATPGTGIMTIPLVLLTIAALYFGRDIFVPFALAILLSFLLAPPVLLLRRACVPRVPAILLVVVFAFAIIGAVSVLVGSQIVQLAQNLPAYQQTMKEKIRAIQAAAPGGGMIDRATAVVESIGQELSAPSAPTRLETMAAGQRKPEPIPVRIESAPRRPFEVIQTILGPLLRSLGMAGVVIVFVIFMLLERNDLRDRFIRLAGGDLHRTTQALNEAASRVSRYLLMQLIVNATYGVPIGIGLYLIGVPGAFLWGLLATLLRFVPYLGPVIAAFFPLVLAFAVDQGWSMVLWTALLLLGMELISNNVVEPWLYRASTGLSSIAIIFAAIFWTLLWGPIGLILATPLTVCLVVMGRHVPQLEFLGVLLGSDPALAPEKRLYQRLLTGNAEEAIDIAESAVAEESVLAFYDKVGVPALRLADDDLQRRAADPGDRIRVADGMRAIVRELSELSKRAADSTSDMPPSQWLGTPVLCVGGRGELDDAAAAMLVHSIELEGIGARSAPPSSITPENIGSLHLAGVDIVCLSYLNPTPQPFARFVCRRLRRRMPGLKIILCLWNIPPDDTNERVAAAVGADLVMTTLAEAVRGVQNMLEHQAPSMVLPPTPAHEEERLEALYASGVLNARSDGQLDRVARKVAEAFEAPIALVSLVDESCQIWKGAAGLPTSLQETRQSGREVSICGHVVAADAPIVVEDTTRDPRFAGNPFLREYNIRFYAGAPLRTASGHAIGSLCVIDTRPRSLASRDIKLLQLIADELMADIERQTDTGLGVAA